MEGDSTKANLLEEDLSKLLLDLDSNSEFPSQLPLHRLDSGEAGQMPEIERLEAFIKELECELSASQSTNDEGNHINYIIEENDEADDTLTTESPSPQRQANLEHFLQALQSTSSTEKPRTMQLTPTSIVNEVTSRSSPRPFPLNVESYVQEISSDNFFSSAQDEDIHTPKYIVTSEPVTPNAQGGTIGSNRNSSKPRIRSFRVLEDFTMESLKRNWEMEEELQDNIAAISNTVLAKNAEDQEIISNMLTPQAIVPPEPPTPETPPQTPPQTPPRTQNESGEDDLSSYNVLRRKSEVDAIEFKIRSPTTKTTLDPELLLKDERLRGDFMVCSAGEKLSNAYIFNEYVGLHPTQLTHYNEDGKLVPSPIARKQYQSQDLTQRNLLGKLGNIDPTAYLSSSSSSSSAGSKAGTQAAKLFYNLHVMECIIRPDIELKSIMAIIVQIARLFQCKCTLLQRSHAVLTPTYSSNISKMTALLSRLSVDHPEDEDGHEAHGSQGERCSLENKEFDCIDVQICVSRSMRQRVILLQFMKKMLPYNGLGFGNILLNHLSGPMEYASLKSCPDTKKFVTKLKRELITNLISFSSLYHCSIVNVCALPQGLDAHFIAQLTSLCRDNMWVRLDAEYKMMEEHVKIQENLTNDFIKAMEPMYKHYALPLPPMQSVGASTLVPYHDLEEVEAPADKKKRRGSDEAGAGIAAIMAMASPSRALLASKYQDGGLMPSKVGKGVDGMAFCLVMLDRTYQDLCFACDEEYGQRVQRKNLATVAAIQERAMYKRLLLTNLFNHPETRSSAFHHAFVQLFQHVPVATTNSRPYDMAVAPAPALPTPAPATQPTSSAPVGAVNTIKGWFSGWSSAPMAATQCFQAPATADEREVKPSAAATQAATAALTTGMFSPAFLQGDDSDALSSSSAIAMTSRSLSNDAGGDGGGDEEPEKVVYPEKLPKSILFYYCACLVGIIRNPTPGATLAVNQMASGTCYISAHYLCLVTSHNLLVGMMNNSIQLMHGQVASAVSSMTQKSKEVYRLQDLQDVAYLPSTQDIHGVTGMAISKESTGEGMAATAATAGRLFAGHGMVKLTFFGGQRAVFLAPLMQEAIKVKNLIDEVRGEFNLAS